LRVTIRAIFDRSRRSYGSPRIYDELKGSGLAIGRNRIIRLMQEQELVARPKKRWRKCEAVPEDQQLVAPNILDREFDADAPNQRWVSDTTELRAGGLRMFLAAVMDLYSRYIVGWSVALVNDRHLVEKALKMAIKRRCPDKGLLAHSDQGCTYTSDDYQRVLKEHGIVCSMSRRGECHDCDDVWVPKSRETLGIASALRA
jgi:transposase InsO family protein